MEATKRFEEALQVCQKVADLSHPTVVYSLTLCHRNVEGLEQDYKMAVQIYKRVADLGDINAVVSLSLYRGRGRKSSKATARQCSCSSKLPV